MCGLSTGRLVPWRCAGFSVTSHVFPTFPVYSLRCVSTEELWSYWLQMGNVAWSLERQKEKWNQTTSPQSTDLFLFLFHLFLLFFMKQAGFNFCTRLCRGQICSAQIWRKKFLNLGMKARLTRGSQCRILFRLIFPLAGKFSFKLESYNISSFIIRRKKTLVK